MHKLELPSEPTFWLELDLLHLLPLLLPFIFSLAAWSYFLVTNILLVSRIQAPSPRHRCGSV